MHTEDAIVNDRSQRKVVKDVCAVSPDVHTAILPQTLVIETINLCDLSALMITSDEHDSFWVANFEGQKQKESLYRVKSSVNKVTHEEIVGDRALSTNFQQLHQIEELAMDVSTNLERGQHFENNLK